MPLAQKKDGNKLDRQNLSEGVTKLIQKHIIDNNLGPGDRLLTENEMAERFGVSRNVIREGTKFLDMLGITKTVPGRGMVLEEFNFEKLGNYLGFQFALSKYPREKILKARIVIETGTLVYVQEEMNKNPQLYLKLMKYVEAIDNAKSMEESIEADIEFHSALVIASGVDPLVGMTSLLHVFFRKYRYVTTHGDFKEKRHRQIIDALHDGQLDIAIEHMRTHLLWYDRRKKDDHGKSQTVISS